MRRVFLLATATWLISGFAYAIDFTSLGSIPPVSQRSPSDEANRLRKFFDFVWAYQLKDNPEFATYIGEFKYNGLLTDRSLKAVQRRKRETREIKAYLKTFKRDLLKGEDRVSYDLFLYLTERGIKGEKFPEEYLAMSQLDGVHQDIPQLLVDMGQSSNQTAKDDFDRLARLSAFPMALEQTQELLEAGLKSKVTQSKNTLKGVPAQLDALASEDFDKNPLFESFLKSSDEIKGLAKKSLTGKVIPAVKKFRVFFVDKYMPGARDDTAMSSLPGGLEWYTHRSQGHTTTMLSSEQIHEIGLKEVERIQTEMKKIYELKGFKGSPREFSEKISKEPGQRFTSRQDALITARDIAKRVEKELPKIFGLLPRQPYGIEPIPEFKEQSSPMAYYMSGNNKAGRAGVFYLNTYKVEERSKYELEALFLHEAVPGHHLQTALSSELEKMPEFRKNYFATAYGEGWGLYAESLGEELGVYQTPESRFGRLSLEIWRAIRLVVDTGLHAKGWTRQQAIDYFSKNSPKDPHDIEVEVDRYVAWPGQALAYKIGEIKIRELKQRAKDKLGASFDVRGFHDTVLGSGSLPLDTLEKKVEGWISAKSRAQSKGKNPL